MRTHALLLSTLLCIGCQTSAEHSNDASTASKSSETQKGKLPRTDELDKLTAEFELAREAFRALPSEERRQENQKKRSPYDTYPPKILDFAQKETDAASLQACVYLLNYRIGNSFRPPVKLVEQHHLEKPGIGKFIHELIRVNDDWDTIDRLLELMISSDNPRTRLYGKYGKARLIMVRRNWCLSGDTERYEDCFDDQQIAGFQSETKRNTASRLLREVVENSANLPYQDGRLADWAQQDLFAINLEIGHPAPNIQGRDLTFTPNPGPCGM